MKQVCSRYLFASGRFEDEPGCVFTLLGAVARRDTHPTSGQGRGAKRCHTVFSVARTMPPLLVPKNPLPLLRAAFPAHREAEKICLQLVSPFQQAGVRPSRSPDPRAGSAHGKAEPLACALGRGLCGQVRLAVGALDISQSLSRVAVRATSTPTGAVGA